MLCSRGCRHHQQQCTLLLKRHHAARLSAASTVQEDARQTKAGTLCIAAGINLAALQARPLLPRTGSQDGAASRLRARQRPATIAAHRRVTSRHNSNTHSHVAACSKQRKTKSESPAGGVAAAFQWKHVMSYNNHDDDVMRAVQCANSIERSLIGCASLAFAVAECTRMRSVHHLWKPPPSSPSPSS